MHCLHRNFPYFKLKKNKTQPPLVCLVQKPVKPEKISDCIEIINILEERNILEKQKSVFF